MIKILKKLGKLDKCIIYVEHLLQKKVLKLFKKNKYPNSTKLDHWKVWECSLQSKANVVNLKKFCNIIRINKYIEIWISC